MSVSSKTGNRAHDDACSAAEGVRQVSSAGATAAQAKAQAEAEAEANAQLEAAARRSSPTPRSLR